MSKSAVIVGLGAQAKYAAEIFRLARGVESLVYCAEQVATCGAFAGMEVRGGLDDLKRDYEEQGRPDLLVCCPNAERKATIVGGLASLRPNFVAAIHPRAVVATNATVGIGTIINAGAIIQPLARIGGFAMIHAGVIVEHDCVVEDYANLAPGAVLTGHVTVGRGAVISAGATVIPNVTIGRGAMVAAGAVVTSDVAAGDRVAGIPAKPMH